MEPGSDFSRMARELPRVTFTAECAYPFLVIGAIEDDLMIDFETRAIDFGQLAAGELDKSRTLTPGEFVEAGVGGTAIIPIVKSEHNPYSERISIGRAKTCDIVLRNGHVSKLHAHFLRADDGAWELRDANSTNGTFRNGQRIPSGDRVPVRSGDRLRFAFLDAQFLDAGSLWDRLRSR
jgi:hypothetical protein